MAAATLWLGLCRSGAQLPGPLALSPDEAARLERTSAPLRAAQYKAGRWLLRRVAALAAGVEPETVALNAQGRPQATLATKAPAPFLSLAHSGDWVLGASCFAPCGVDLERLGARRDWSGLAHRLGLPRSAGETEVLRSWTLKEARFKAQEPALSSVWRFETPDYTACVVGPPDAAVETRRFDNGPRIEWIRT